MTKQELFALLNKYLEGNASKEEIDLLSRYYNSFQQNGHWNETELGQKSNIEAKIFKHIQEKIRASNKKSTIESIINQENVQEGKVLHLKRRPKIFTFTRIAAAASIIGLLLLVTFVWYNRGGKKEIAQTEVKNKSYKNDILPGGDKAILTLADGSTIVLDDALNGTLTQQGNTKVIKLGGRLAYDPAHTDSKEVVYNTISTPRGGQYQVELPDGTNVWLNAASSIKFPTAFIGKERRVDITGEGYFEVAKNKYMPFIVGVNGAEVQVFGTHFNVMAYNDEAAIKTTLLEGSVKFVNGNSAHMLQPGQQSQLTKDGQVKVVKDVDVDEVVAWKNGLFYFENANIETVMRQLSRWYDVEVVYQNEQDADPLHAEIPRNTKLSDALKALELTGSARFKIEGRKVIVIN